jgi:hypothetical protein
LLNLLLLLLLMVMVWLGILLDLHQVQRFIAPLLPQFKLRQVKP